MNTKKGKSPQNRAYLVAKVHLFPFTPLVETLKVRSVKNI